ncbi:MAG: DNA ligase D [Rhodanobacteraceae bacterium]
MARRKRADRDRLREYHKRREFTATSEPAGSKRKPGKGRIGKPIFVVQLHEASRRHFDFRLELDGTLRSWAVPKGPSADPAEKRLAVQVEDHPLEYARFEGSIPAGSYGAGVVQIWDRGHWSCEGDAAVALDKGHLHFTLYGQRLKGDWTLVRTGRGGKQWLLIKVKDRHAGDDIHATSPSASTHRKRVREMADECDVQLATLAESEPGKGQWIHEIKYDGYRVLIARRGRQVCIRSRNGQDWTPLLSTAAAAAVALNCRSCVLDGELVMWDARGRSSFSALQEAFGNDALRRSEVMCFDLLEKNGRNLRSQPLKRRRAMLESLLRQADRPLRLSQVLDGPPEELRKAACAHGLEGIIAKDIAAPYSAGRNRHWLKLKCVAGDEFLAIGYTPGQGVRKSLGSLLLAEWKQDAWHYCGRAGSGLDQDLIARVLRLPTTTGIPGDIRNLPTRAQLRGAAPTWLEQRPVVEANYRGRTRDGLLRQPAVKGVRMDKSARSLKRDSDRSPKEASTMLTHPDKRLFEQPPVTKAQLADYYRSVAPQLLAEAGNRPISLLRCPDGIDGECFFQKHATSGMASGVHVIDIADNSGKVKPYVWVDSAEGLAALVQLGTIELHAWGSRAGDIERPDRIVFDLDPAKDVSWKKVKDAARLVRKRLSAVGLQSWVRTSGGKGLHVVLPITGATWDQAKGFAHAVAKAIANERPRQFLVTAAKSARNGRIFIDYLRNSRGATAVTNYSVRARPGARVATPLRWDELARLRSADQYDINNVLRRVAQLKGDPWKGIGSRRQKLPRT